MKTTLMTSFTTLRVATDFPVDGNHAARRAALVVHEHGAQASGGRPLGNGFAPTPDSEGNAP